ncbi:hypothetical protein M406DRAFT_341185 [Cryphonectria parasitica EP155]|uniref:Uncharacterized protein n=1 Tax=Cryphonectria parasitica (strain ATCC 38755 / EP155) TaxID=660469 RepID=A0A9P4XZJ6_CRYP1|nr:uncharacterized protein M406DRAFT_341185 [Cryphonectria parasitica EP155]KAF3763763.1 hypothetical protein M406DRAFT_341185 [Cryphonectria parasitica EP155]
MAWGKAKPQPSLLSQLLPLVIFFTVIAGLAWVGYQIYLSVNQMQGNVSQRMGKKNVVFTKDGLKVGVKHVKHENEVDATQKYLVNAWNLHANKEAAGKKSK